MIFDASTFDMEINAYGSNHPNKIGQVHIAKEIF